MRLMGSNEIIDFGELKTARYDRYNIIYYYET